MAYTEVYTITENKMSKGRRMSVSVSKDTSLTPDDADFAGVSLNTTWPVTVYAE